MPHLRTTLRTLAGFGAREGSKFPKQSQALPAFTVNISKFETRFTKQFFVQRNAIPDFRQDIEKAPVQELENERFLSFSLTMQFDLEYLTLKFAGRSIPETVCTNSKG